ncbi:DUF1275 family protein [Enterobacter hormaechei]
MGIHNSTSTQLSGGRVRSTHITGTLTDAGISLASVMVAMMRRDYSKDTAAQKSQLKTHLTTLFSFISGGIAGLILFRDWIPRDAGAGPAAGSRHRLLYRPHLVAGTKSARRA